MHLTSGPIEPTQFFQHLDLFGITQPSLTSSIECEKAVHELESALTARARKDAAAFVECGKCRRKYPDVKAFPVCPFCSSDDIVVSKEEETDSVTASPPPSTEANGAANGEKFVSPIHKKALGLKEKQLVDRVEKIEALSRSTMRGLFEIGQHFQYIYEKNLWQSDRGVKADDFKEWVEARTGWSFQTVDRLMKVARSFSIDVIETTTRIKISGLIEIEKVMRGLPPEQAGEAREEAVKEVEAKAKKTPLTTKQVSEIATKVREDLVGKDEEDAIEVVEVNKENGVVGARAPDAAPVNKTADFFSKKFMVLWSSQAKPGTISVGDVLRAELPNGFKLEVQLSLEGASFYYYK